jgi:hypothetical protein
MRDTSDKEQDASKGAQGERGCITVDNDGRIAVFAWWWPVRIDPAAGWRLWHLSLLFTT